MKLTMQALHGVEQVSFRILGGSIQLNLQSAEQEYENKPQFALLGGVELPKKRNWH